MSRTPKGGGRPDRDAGADTAPEPTPTSPGSSASSASQASAAPQSERPAAPPPPPPRLELPAWGMADEILAGLDAGGLGGVGPTAFMTSAVPASAVAPVADSLSAPPAAAAATTAARHRVYSFADALARRGAAVARAAQEQPESWVIFELAGEHFGLPVTSVQEILRVGAITRVPHTPAPVRGITNLRGRVLAVVDLRVRLGMPSAELTARNRILVVDSRQRTLGLLVDAALQVVKLLPSTLEVAPSDVVSMRSDYLLGVYHLDDQLIIALDLDRVLLVHPEAGDGADSGEADDPAGAAGTLGTAAGPAAAALPAPAAGPEP
jgi:purine-binding chemotaxis protein CheW